MKEQWLLKKRKTAENMFPELHKKISTSKFLYNMNDKIQLINYPQKGIIVIVFSKA